jgi:hypothetical protein
LLAGYRCYRSLQLMPSESRNSEACRTNDL